MQAEEFLEALTKNMESGQGAYAESYAAGQALANEVTKKMTELRKEEQERERLKYEALAQYGSPVVPQMEAKSQHQMILELVEETKELRDRVTRLEQLFYEMGGGQ